MDLEILTSSIAAILTTASFLPQALKTILTRDTRAISLWMYILLVTGLGFFIWFGFLIENPALIAGNSITFALASVILIFKIRELRKKACEG